MVPESAEEGTEHSEGTASEVEQQRDSMEHHKVLNKILPWLVLLLASLALLYFLNRGCARQYGSSGNTGKSTTEQTTASGNKFKISNPSSVAGRVERMLAAGAPDPNVVFVLDSVDFVDDGSTLTRASTGQLEDLVKVLFGHKELQIRVEGHTDNAGSFRDNLELSRQRALAVKTFLKEHGLPSEQIVVVGRGQYKPLVPNDSPSARAKNNRIELYLSQAQ